MNYIMHSFSIDESTKYTGITQALHSTFPLRFHSLKEQDDR